MTSYGVSRGARPHVVIRFNMAAPMTETSRDQNIMNTMKQTQISAKIRRRRGQIMSPNLPTEGRGRLRLHTAPLTIMVWRERQSTAALARNTQRQTYRLPHTRTRCPTSMQYGRYVRRTMTHIAWTHTHECSETTEGTSGLHLVKIPLPTTWYSYITQ